jgi:hypothetical protein
VGPLCVISLLHFMRLVGCTNGARHWAEVGQLVKQACTSVSLYFSGTLQHVHSFTQLVSKLEFPECVHLAGFVLARWPIFAGCNFAGCSQRDRLFPQ